MQSKIMLFSTFISIFCIYISTAINALSTPKLIGLIESLSLKHPIIICGGNSCRKKIMVSLSAKLVAENHMVNVINFAHLHNLKMTNTANQLFHQPILILGEDIKMENIDMQNATNCNKCREDK